MVVNAPTVQHRERPPSNAVALLLSAAGGNVPQAMGVAAEAGSGSGRAFTGVELQDKVAGILGLGRIGVLVAQRLRGVRG